MLARMFFLMLLGLLLTGCLNKPLVSQHLDFSSRQTNQSLPAFSRVYVDGRVNIDLRTGYSRPHVVLRGDQHDIAQVQTYVVDGALFVKLGPHYPNRGSVTVEIDARKLTIFKYHGVGLITGRRLFTNSLDLYIDNPGKTTLQGQIGLRQLTLSGGGYTEIGGIRSRGLFLHLSEKSKVKLAGVINISSIDVSHDSFLSMYWVSSKALIIRARDKANIQLAGIVQKLDVELWGSARFNGRYLRADRAFVKTHDKSVAEMSAVMRQHTLARDDSDVRFYSIPQMKADFMVNNGAVLDMRDLGLPFVQEYDEYNK